MTVRRLLTGHTELPKSGDAKAIDRDRRDAANVRVDPSVHRCRGSQRDLLLENDFDECRESWTTAPDWRIAEATMNRTEVPVTRGKEARALA